MYHALSEKLKKVAEGNEKAFRQVVRLYYDRLYQFAFGIIKNSEDAEEAIYDVFFKVWQLREQLPAERSFTSYLYKAVKNTSLNYLKKKHRKEEVESIYKIEPGDIGLQSPEELIISEETLKHIRKAINTLPLRCRQIFILVKEDGLSYREVAELLEISPATVNVQMTIAVKKLWKALDLDRQYF